MKRQISVRNNEMLSLNRPLKRDNISAPKENPTWLGFDVSSNQIRLQFVQRTPAYRESKTRKIAE